MWENKDENYDQEHAKFGHGAPAVFSGIFKLILFPAAAVLGC